MGWALLRLVPWVSLWPPFLDREADSKCLMQQQEMQQPADLMKQHPFHYSYLAAERGWRGGVRKPGARGNLSFQLGSSFCFKVQSPQRS